MNTAQMTYWHLLAPEILLIFAALTNMLLSISPRQRRYGFGVGIIGLVLAAWSALHGMGAEASLFNGMYLLDPLAMLLKFVFLASALLGLLLSVDFIRSNKALSGEYISLMLFSCLGMMLMASAGDLMVIFLGLEILSIALYVLVGFRRTDPVSLEAAIKYFLLGAFASGFLLYGLALVYGATGSTNIADMVHQLQWKAAAGGPLLNIGLGLILVGFGFKVSLVPFHMWTPDVYEGAPTPITAFMSAGAKAAGFAAIIRVFFAVSGAVDADWVAVLWILAALTATVGNILALVQENIKRMLAYSSIAHAGIILIAATAVAAQVDTGVSAMLYYLLIYTFMNLGAFGVIVWLSGEKQEAVSIANYAGLSHRRPLVAALMAIFMFALAGIPPTAGFLGKFYTFRAAMEAGLTGLTIIGVLNSVLAVYFYLRIVVVMYMKPVPEGDIPLGRGNQFATTALLISAIFILYFGLFPEPLLALLRSIS
jgi:NADH-quinone oxidoreductase subunit N